MAVAADRSIEERDRGVRRVILIEGSANAAVLALKLVVGLSTGSLAVLGDAIHSLTDVANNVAAWFVARVSAEPADREHPYGHRKFETLAVFVLATLLSVLALELVLGVIRGGAAEISHEGWALALMLGVLAINVGLASWEAGWARRLDSELLRADARHTFADVLTTAVVIAGWQIAARGHPWLDRACALAVAGLVLFLAFGLFRRAIPVLVDRAAIDSELLVAAARSVPGVRTVRSARSRSTGSGAAIDLVVSVEPSLSTTESHQIADRIERQIRQRFAVDDVSIHIEPDR
jgi:cation diffusion facilitator family transporter